MHHIGYQHGLKDRLSVIENPPLLEAARWAAPGSAPEAALAEVGIAALSPLEAGFLSSGQLRRLPWPGCSSASGPCGSSMSRARRWTLKAKHRVAASIDRHRESGGAAIIATDHDLPLAVAPRSARAGGGIMSAFLAAIGRRSRVSPSARRRRSADAGARSSSWSAGHRCPSRSEPTGGAVDMRLPTGIVWIAAFLAMLLGLDRLGPRRRRGWLAAPVHHLGDCRGGAIVAGKSIGALARRPRCRLASRPRSSPPLSMTMEQWTKTVLHCCAERLRSPASAPSAPLSLRVSGAAG